MKTIKFSIDLKSVMLFIIFLVVLFVFSSCAKKISFLNSRIVPAARGQVAIKNDKNKNYNIKIQLSYLAEPDRLQPPKSTYVVWMVSDESEIPINLGQIIGTSKLNINFETVSASKPRRIFITAEDDASIQYPANTVVLETNNF
jgi:hypothetical protein